MEVGQAERRAEFGGEHEAVGLILAAERWNALEDARIRSAISRAYYAVLLTLKQRLHDVARYDLPPDGANAVAREALTEVVGEKHELSNLFRRLWSYRTRADYDLGTGYRASVADDRLDDAKVACGLIDDLTTDQVLDIASAARIASGRLRARRSRK